MKIGQRRRQEVKTITKKHEEMFGVMNKVTVMIVMIIPWMYSDIKTYQIVHFTYAQFTACQLCLNKGC